MLLTSDVRRIREQILLKLTRKTIIILTKPLDKHSGVLLLLISVVQQYRLKMLISTSISTLIIPINSLKLLFERINSSLKIKRLLRKHTTFFMHKIPPIIGHEEQYINILVFEHRTFLNDKRVGKRMFSRKTLVILDTNTLLLPDKGIDIFGLIHEAMQEPYKLCTYKTVITELAKLAEKKGRAGFGAKLGYIMAKQKDLKILNSSSEGHTDDIIVQKAQPKTTVVATQDRDLIKRLREKGVRVLRYQQHHFVFVD